MEFNINGNLWKIEVIPKDLLVKIYKDTVQDEEEPIFCYGVTIYPQQTIYINKDMAEQQQIKTLKHELTHCYIWNSGLYNVPNFTEEMVCDLVSCSNDFVNEVVELFELKKGGKYE